MPDLKWNNDLWETSYNWDSAGEEWSGDWGGSAAQWFGSLHPRLHRFLPSRSILEIAPGFGRWTKFLLPECRKYVGIDLSAKCIEACRKSFAAATHATFEKNNGVSLDDAPEGLDLVFSYDSLVHAEIRVLKHYIPQIIRKLAPSGVAFIHHSNLLPYGDTIANPHARAKTVSADNVAALVTRHGGKILVQELINWGGEDTHDCLTLFCRQDAYAGTAPVTLKNPNYMAEAALIKNFQSPYSTIGT